jgi:hypothetical protein
MNPLFIFLITILVIIVAGAIYTWYFTPKSDESRVLGPFVLKGTPSENEPAGSSSLRPVLTQAQLNQSIKSNFTLGFFIYMDKVNAERIPFAGPEGDFRFKPLLKILGVGEFVLDPVHQKGLLRLTPLVAPMTPRTSGVPRAKIDRIWNARWNQVAISVEGRSIDIYVNGKHVTSLILDNVTWTNPTGVLLETSPDFWGQAGMIQAWPRRLNEREIWENYKRVTDIYGKPNIPDIGPTYGGIWKQFVDLVCHAGFCPNMGKKGKRKGHPNGLEYVDYEYA